MGALRSSSLCLLEAAPMNRAKLLIGQVESCALSDGNDIGLKLGFHAITKTVVVAADEAEFEGAVRLRLDQMGLAFLACEDVRPVSSEEEVSLRMQLSRLDDVDRVKFLTFHVFPVENGICDEGS